MPLTSKNDGPALQVGDIVRMEWVISRIFPSRLNVVQVALPGSLGENASSPSQTVAMRLGTRPSALTTVPPGAPVAEGTHALLLWRVTAVFPETGTVRVERDGLGGLPTALVPVTLATGARALDLEYVPPGETQPAAQRSRPWSLEASVDIPDPDMLPFGFDPVDPLGALPEPEPPAPVVASVSPDMATLGSPSFTLHVLGTGFDLGDVIVFAGMDEPTTVVSPTEVTTGVDMSVWLGPDTLPVGVRSASGVLSNTVPFTFLPAATQASDPGGDQPGEGMPACDG